MSEKKEEIGLDEDDDTPLVLLSADKKKFEVQRKAAYMSKYVETIAKGDKSTTEILVDGVSGEILSLVVDYLKYHMGKIPPEIKKPLRSLEMKKVVSDEWDANFIDNLENKVLLDLILGANYMDVNSLLHLGCAKLASLIKNKSHDEIRAFFTKAQAPST